MNFYNKLKNALFSIQLSIGGSWDGWPDDWFKYQETGATVDSFWSTISKFGQRSIGIGTTTGCTVVKDNPSLIPHQVGKSYVLSGYIQTTNLSSKAAYLAVYFYDNYPNT